MSLRYLSAGFRYTTLSVGAGAIASEKCLLLPGDTIIPNNLTIHVGHLMMLLQCGSMGKELAKYNTKLFSEKVMPRLRGLFSAWEDTWWPAPMAQSERAAPTPFHAPAITAE